MKLKAKNEVIKLLLETVKTANAKCHELDRLAHILKIDNDNMKVTC